MKLRKEKKNRKLFFDIEVEVTEGFPDVMKATNVITSIALYDFMTETYFTYVYDAKRRLTSYTKDNKIVGHRYTKFDSERFEFE
mgnify:CR=1 FL=1